MRGTVRPLGGYQIKPRYQEWARRQGIEGTVLPNAGRAAGCAPSVRMPLAKTRGVQQEVSAPSPWTPRPWLCSPAQRFAPRLLDHLIRLEKKRRGDREPERLGLPARHRGEGTVKSAGLADLDEVQPSPQRRVSRSTGAVQDAGSANDEG